MLAPRSLKERFTRWPTGPMIEAVTARSRDDLLGLRRALWPHCPDERHRREIETMLSAPDRFAAFICYDSSGLPAGFAEAAVRGDYVNGTSSSPVAFLEGIYVAPAFRRTGIARELIAAVSRWAKRSGLTELASDADVGNETSHAMHLALGFEETERVVFFRKLLGADDQR